VEAVEPDAETLGYVAVEGNGVWKVGKEEEEEEEAEPEKTEGCCTKDVVIEGKPAPQYGTEE